jgi:hypothetical protein
MKAKETIGKGKKVCGLYGDKIRPSSHRSQFNYFDDKLLGHQQISPEGIMEKEVNRTSERAR